MKGIEIPPKFNVYRFNLVFDTLPQPLNKLVFAPDLESALRFIKRYVYEQGIDADFYYMEEVSLFDCHVYYQDYYQCVLDL